MANVKISQISTEETTVANTLLMEGERADGTSVKVTRLNLLDGVPLVDVTADQTPAELTAIARADIDQDDDLALIWDNSAGELKTIAFQDLFDLEINRPSADFAVSSTTRPGTLFAPTAGTTCTISAMRVGQVVPVRNTSGGSYTFSASGVTITGDTSVADNKAATILAVTASVIFITAES